MQTTENSQVIISPSVRQHLSAERMDALKEVANEYARIAGAFVEQLLHPSLG